MERPKVSDMSPEEAQAALIEEDFEFRGGGVRKHWLEIKAGFKEQPDGQGQRGKDKPDTVRKISASKTIATRYYERTGRRFEQEMQMEKEMIHLMFEAAAEMEDPQERFQALEKAQKAQATFNKTFAPYLEQKLGTLQSERTVESARDADAAILAALEDKSDED